MIEIDRSEGISLGQHIGDTVRVAGPHRGQCGAVICPGAGILRAGMALRLLRHERRLLKTAIRLLRPAPDRPLRPLDQRRQSARQLREISLACCRFCVAFHGALLKVEAASRCRSSPLPSLLKKVSRRPFRRGSASPDPAQARDPPVPPAETLRPRHYLKLASAAGCAPAGRGPSCRGTRPWMETR